MNLATGSDQNISSRPLRSAGVDAAKGLAILGVMCAHAGKPADFGGDLGLIQFALGWCVTAFFAFSGYLEANSNPASTFPEYCRRRARRLLLPWVALHFANNLALWLLAKSGLIRSLEIRDANWIEVLLAAWSPQMYFLPLLFLVGIVLWWPLRRSPAITLTALAGVSSVALFSFREVGFGYGSSVLNWPTYATAFALGFVLRHGAPKIWAVILLCVAGVLEIYFRGAYQVLHPLVGPALIVLFSGVRGDLLRPLAFLGRWSFTVFLWHAPLVMPLMLLLARRLDVPPAIHLVLAISSAAAISIGIGRALFAMRLKWLAS